MTPFEYIKNCVVTRIKPSPTHGVGLFAIKDIKKGDFVFQQWLGETGIYKITDEEFKQLSKLQQLYLTAMFPNKNEIRLRNGCYFIFVIPYCFMNYNTNEMGNINAQTGEALCDIKCNEELFTQFIYDGNKTII
jgi:hypothetical protein